MTGGRTSEAIAICHPGRTGPRPAPGPVASLVTGGRPCLPARWAAAGPAGARPGPMCHDSPGVRSVAWERQVLLSF